MSVYTFVKIIWYDRAVWYFIDDNDSSFYHDPIPKVAASFCFRIIKALNSFDPYPLHWAIIASDKIEASCFFFFFLKISCH